MKLSILIPVYNEEKTIIDVLKRIKKTKADDIDYEIIVINDGSTDGTKKLLEENNTLYNSLINNSRNSGKGFSVKQGLKISTGEYIIFQDADLEYDPGDFKKLINPILEGIADVVYGSRFIGDSERRVLYFWHMVGNKFLTLLSNMLTNLNLSDMEVCYKVFRSEIIKDINLKPQFLKFLKNVKIETFTYSEDS